MLFLFQFGFCVGDILINFGVYACFQYEALGWLCGGLGFFATLGLMATFNDKASKIPFVSHMILIVIFLFCALYIYTCMIVKGLKNIVPSLRAG